MPIRRRKGTRLIGWREWIGLPDLGIETIKAKVDTGASTSALHAVDIRPHDIDGRQHVAFVIHPVQRRQRPAVECVMPVHDHRAVVSSSGHREERYVIRTYATLGGFRWPIEVTLTDRDAMGFRMLLGREALRRRFLVDPGHSFIAGTMTARAKSVRSERETER